MSNNKSKKGKKSGKTVWFTVDDYKILVERAVSAGYRVGRGRYSQLRLYIMTVTNLPRILDDEVLKIAQKCVTRIIANDGLKDEEYMVQCVQDALREYLDFVAKGQGNQEH